MKTRGFLDRDFVRTREGFFCVIGPHHPLDRVISYLKYVPDQRGKWKHGNERYKRVMPTYTMSNLLKTFQLLERQYPHYLFFSSVYNITMTGVPRDLILEHYRPEQKLHTLAEKRVKDKLQEKLLHLVSLLSESSKAPVRDFGVIGSILLEIHDPTLSDIDLTIYGVRNSYAVKDAITKIHSTLDSHLTPFKGERLKRWCVNKAKKHPITAEEAKKIYERKWNIGVYQNTLFSIHPIKKQNELTEQYGDHIYYPAERVSVQAVISDSRDSIFLPSVYKVTEVDHDGKTSQIEEVVSYESLYGSLAEEEEVIAVKGKLEHVLDTHTGRKFDRVVVGSLEGRGEEYIKLIS